MTTWRVLDLIKSSTDYLSRKGVPDPRLDAEYLLGEVLGKKRLELYLHFDRPLDEGELMRYREHIRRRGQREPLQHILGMTEFMGLPFKTTAAALVPRPETEILVEKALQLLGGKQGPVLDIGTGTGCIAIALAHGMKDIRITALDISERALELARSNADMNKVSQQIEFLSLDILKEYPPDDKRFDLVISNPPYISEKEKDQLQDEVRKYDPETALFADREGLIFYERFTEILSRLLKPGGYFAFEFGGRHQEKPLINLFMETGYRELEIIQDYNGDPRVICGRYFP